MEAYLKRFPKGIPEPEARRFLCQIAAAFQYLSTQGYMHRDMKPANMLLTDFSSGGVPDVKLSDFGFARHYENGVLMNSKVGSPLYMAPEVLGMKPYSSSIDVWSTGIIFIQLVTGKRPFPMAREEIDVYNFARDEKYISSLIESLNVSLEAKSLLSGMLTLDPKKRMNWESFLEHDYVRPKESLKASFVAGVANWILKVTSYETGFQFPVPADASLPIAELRNRIHAMLRCGHNVNETILITQRNGEMVDGLTVGDYFKPNISANGSNASQSAPPDRLDIHLFRRSTLNGNLDIFKLKDGELAAPEKKKFEVAPLPAAPAPLSQITLAVSEYSFKQLIESATALSQSIDATGRAENWHAILVGWKIAIESHMQHANDLLQYIGKLKVFMRQAQSVANRKTSTLALTNFLRILYTERIRSFERVSTVLKEVSAPMSKVPTQIPKMFEEAEKVSLRPVLEAFPSLQISPDTTLDQLLSKPDMLSDLERMVDIHRKCLFGELMFSRSSDATAAAHYGIAGSEYNGSSFSVNLAAINASPNKDTPIPVLILSMVELNKTLSSFPFALRERLLTAWSSLSTTIQEVETCHALLNEKCSISLENVCSALQKPSSFVLTSDMLTPASSCLIPLQEAYERLNKAVSVVLAKTEVLVSYRQEYDAGCLKQMIELNTHRQPFETFESKFKTDWTPEALDFLASKSKSLERLILFPQHFRELMIEIERRRKWTLAVHECANQSREAFSEILENERQRRDEWWAQHPSSITRFKLVLPPRYEILSRMAPGSMTAKLDLIGLLDYPALPQYLSLPPAGYQNLSSSQHGSSSQGSNGSSPSVAGASNGSEGNYFKPPPTPQNATEQADAEKSSKELLETVLELRRENDTMRRTRQNFFQQGLDQAAIAEIQRLTEQNAALQAELDRYRSGKR